MFDSRIQFLQIEPTTRCNFTCGFCVGRHMRQRDMAWETYEEVLRAFPKLAHIELQGEGEPLLHPRFFDMVEAAHRRHPYIQVSTITNGSLLETHVERLLDVGLHRILVSIESPDPAEFRAIRGGDLAVVTRGIERLTTERRRRGLADPAVGFAVTLLRRTRRAVPAIVELYERLGMDGGIAIQPLQIMPTYQVLYSAETRAEILSLSDAQEFTEAIQNDARVRQVLRRPVRAISFYRQMWHAMCDAPPGCAWLERGLFIDAGGEALPCCFVKDAGDHGLGAVTLEGQRIVARRAEMQAQLRSGTIPLACAHCDAARRLVANRR